MQRIYQRIAAAAVAAGCLAGAPARAKDLRIGFTSDPLTLDPGNHRPRETESVLRTMYSGVAAYDPAMKPVPELAESWRWIDPKTLEVKLRRGVKFHSGEEMSAEDVAYTFDRLLRKDAIDGQTSPVRACSDPPRP